MEKSVDKRQTHPRIVIITGAESTGKTELAKYLSAKTGMEWVPEFAREYVENLHRDYTQKDVEIIAEKQIKELQHYSKQKKGAIFDTGLIITKIWFDIVFGNTPKWLIDTLNTMPKHLHLLCDIDLPWQPDPVRENGGEMRAKLHNIYKQELEKYEFPYSIISGMGKERFIKAEDVVREYFKR